jgi:dipeptidyl aminopeptidase/acylaminoacyl peptidase
MSFDTRIRDHLREAGDRLSMPPADLAGVVSRGRRRRMTRGLASGVTSAALIIGGIVLIQAQPFGRPVVSQPTSTTTATSQAAVNGWVAFAAYNSAGDNDIYLIREGESARRIVGSDSDGLEEVCPAFSADGARLAYGQAQGTADIGYSGGRLVVAGLDQDGNATTTLEIDVGATSAPPCPLWSPDGQRIAIAVHSGDRVSSPQGSARWGDVWMVSLDSGEKTVLPSLFVWDGGWGFPDMEWSPDGAELAVAKGQIWLYSALTGELRSLDGTSGAQSLTWSPDGTRIAYQRSGSGPSSSSSPWLGGELRIAEVDGSGDYLLAGGFEAFHGIGPVWSPDGDRIVYQRVCSTYASSFSPTQPCREEHDVVLVTLDGTETVLPHLRMPGTDATEPMWPMRVTWSPDGEQLLYRVWGSEDSDFTDALIAVPLDPSSPPVVIHEGDGGYVDDDWFGFQSWGREPEGQ